MTKVKALLMAIVLLSLGLFIYQTEQREFQERISTLKSEELILPNVKEEQIKQIHVVAFESSYRLEKSKNDTWFLVRPEGVPANIEKVTAIINTLLRTTAKNIILENEIDKDQSLYGLQPPAMVLTLDGDFGKRVFSFGKRIQASGRRYVQSQSDKRFFLVDDNVFNLINVTSDELFNKAPFNIESNKITEFSVMQEAKNLIRFRKDNVTNQWKILTKEREYIADSEMIEQKLASLNKIKAKHVSELTGDTLALYGLKIPKIAISYIVSDVQEHGFLVGEGVNLDVLDPANYSDVENTEKMVNQLAYYIKLQGDDFAYQIPHIFFSELLQPAYYFQNKHTFSQIKKEQIEKIVIKNGDKIKEIFLSSEPELFEKLKSFISEFRVVSYQVVSTEERKNLDFEKSEYALEYFMKDTSISITLGKELETQQKLKIYSPRWVELKLINGEIIPAVINSDTYNALKVIYPK